MRIRSVSIEGFGPFKSKQFVDFRAFDADGLFLIAGETGVGKTSVLDAVAYALYNKTPRWDNVSATGASNSVRSDFCGVDDSTEVIVEFETNGREYRVSRSPEYDRPKSRGEGTTKQSAKILVEVLEDEAWLGKATKERDAAELVHDLLKLNKDEFLQVIMLAQGRFQEFLLADSGQRLELLSKLFGTGRFADYQQSIADRRSALKASVDSARTQLGLLLSGIEAPEELGEATAGQETVWLEAVIAEAKTDVRAKEAAIKAAGKAEKAARAQWDIAKLQVRREMATNALEELASLQGGVDSDKKELFRAERAERLRHVLEDAATKLETRARTEADVSRARLGYKGGADDDALSDEVSKIGEEVGKLSDALPDELLAVALESERAAKVAEKSQLDTVLAHNLESITALQGERLKVAPVAALATSAQEKVQRVTDQLAAATESANVAAQLRKAQLAQLTADQNLTAARSSAEAVLGQFLHGQAAVLAEKLVDGEPCSVCGSLEHPLAASFSGESITQEDVDAAQAEVKRLEPKATTATGIVDHLKVKAAGLSAAAGNGTVATREAAVGQARAELKGALAAVNRVGEIDELLQGEGGLIAAGKRLQSTTTETAAQLTKLKTQHDSVSKKLTRLRGDFATVKARYESLVAERNAAKQLADALAKHEDAAKQLANSEKKLETKLKQEKFELAEHAEDALLGDTKMKAIKTRIEKHASAVSEYRGVLKQEELQDLPAEVIDVSTAKAAHRASERHSVGATAEKADADSVLKSLGTKQESLQSILASTKDLVAQFDILNRLAETVNGRTPNSKGMSLESYYIAAELEGVLQAASVRLRTLSRGRFEFRHTERGVRRANSAAGLEIEIFDEYTGTARPANQLSGGQQFLASLALALGLAEVVTSRAGGIELNTLFVDEGFGSLSTEYLEIAMETLDSLKQGGRTVGVISHVASMQEQIATQLLVVAEPGGPSEILQATI